MSQVKSWDGEAGGRARKFKPKECSGVQAQQIKEQDEWMEWA